MKLFIFWYWIWYRKQNSDWFSFTHCLPGGEGETVSADLLIGTESPVKSNTVEVLKIRLDLFMVKGDIYQLKIKDQSAIE